MAAIVIGKLIYERKLYAISIRKMLFDDNCIVDVLFTCIQKLNASNGQIPNRCVSKHEIQFGCHWKFKRITKSKLQLQQNWVTHIPIASLFRQCIEQKQSVPAALQAIGPSNAHIWPNRLRKRGNGSTSETNNLNKQQQVDGNKTVHTSTEKQMNRKKSSRNWAPTKFENKFWINFRLWFVTRQNLGMNKRGDAASSWWTTDATYLFLRCNCVWGRRDTRFTDDRVKWIELNEGHLIWARESAVVECQVNQKFHFVTECAQLLARTRFIVSIRVFFLSLL